MFTDSTVGEANPDSLAIAAIDLPIAVPTLSVKRGCPQFLLHHYET